MAFSFMDIYLLRVSHTSTIFAANKDEGGRFKLLELSWQPCLLWCRTPAGSVREEVWDANFVFLYWLTPHSLIGFDVGVWDEMAE